jgi:hypothetical protein
LVSELVPRGFREASKGVVHLRVLAPRDTPQMSVKDYAFKINVLVGDLERGVLAPVDDDSGDDGVLDVYLCLINLFLS